MNETKSFEEEHQFNKKNAQLLMHQLNYFIVVLKTFCDKYYSEGDMDKILIVIKHILQLSDKLYCELDTCEVVNIEYENKKNGG